MKPIGGYFELELPKYSRDFPHALCTSLNSGRHALEYILCQLWNKARLIYIPYYTCDVVLEPIRRLNIGYQFYHIDENLEIKHLPDLSDGHYLIANNYFGIKDEYISYLHNELGSKLIVDNAQAYFAKEQFGLKAFFSPRKFVGIPDGGFACTSEETELEIPKDFSADRSTHLLRRIDSGAGTGYKEFKENSQKLSEEPMKIMSELTCRILGAIDFDEVKYRRRYNFDYLHQALASTNLLDIPDTRSFACPMVYPYRTKKRDLRARLLANDIFVAKYWPNVLEWCDAKSIEHSLAQEIIPLPIDQRYDLKDMDRILNIIKSDA